MASRVQVLEVGTTLDSTEIFLRTKANLQTYIGRQEGTIYPAEPLTVTKVISLILIIQIALVPCWQSERPGILPKVAQLVSF